MMYDDEHAKQYADFQAVMNNAGELNISEEEERVALAVISDLVLELGAADDEWPLYSPDVLERIRNLLALAEVLRYLDLPTDADQYTDIYLEDLRRRLTGGKDAR